MSAPPFMQVYVADYTADTTHLTCEQDGAYWRLLRAMWRAGGKLPARHDKLALIAGLTLDHWVEINRDVMALFVRRGGSLSHKRLTSELAKYHSICERAKKGGNASAAKRASKNNGAGGDLVEPELPPKPNKPEPEPEPERDKPPKPPKGAFEAFYQAYPLHKGKLQAEKNFPAAWARIAADNDEARLAVLLAGVGRFVGELRRRPTDKVAHPGTWLSGGRWMDEEPAGLFDAEERERRKWAPF